MRASKCQRGLLAVLLVPLWACGEDAPEATAVDEIVVEEIAVEAPAEVDPDELAPTERGEREKAESLAILKAASDFLATQQQFSFNAELGWDSVQVTGQKIEFGGSRSVSVRRPDRVRIEAKSRDGDAMMLFFDGQHLSIDLPEENAYVSVEKPGSLDAALDYLVDDMGVKAPLSDLLHTDLYAAVAPNVRSGFWVEESSVGGVLCDHTAFSTDALDAQIWVEQGDRPLIRRIVLSYKNEPGSPQFWAQLSDWRPLAEAPDSLFSYQPPKGAERLPMRAALDAVAEEMAQ